MFLLIIDVFDDGLNKTTQIKSNYINKMPKPVT